MVLLLGVPEHFISNLSPMQINGSNIGFVRITKSLDVTVNRELNMSNHVKLNCGQTIAMLRNLWMSQNFITTNIRMQLAKTYLLPTLMYGCELFASCSAVSRCRLYVTYNATAQHIFSISHFGRLIYSVTFDNLMNCRTLLFLHKFIYN